MYAVAGAAASVVTCLGAMALVPTVMNPVPASLARAAGPIVIDPAAAYTTPAAPYTTPPTTPATGLAAATAPAATPAATPASQQGDHPGGRPGRNNGQAAPATPAGQLASLTATSDCTLTVPANPRTAAGLMTPYVLSNGNDGVQCAETSETTAAFVQALILDPATGALSAYDPVVTDAANPQVTVPPVTLPPNAVVTIWTGFNDNVLKLAGPGAGQFVNFAQQSYASSPLFFAWLRFDVARGLTRVPALGTSAADNMTCPSVRDFSVVDQDQSDNVPVSYGAPFMVSNGSDDDLLTLIDTSLGCTPWEVPLQDPGVTQSGAAMTTAGPLEEVQAALMQGAPQALVPGLDPFVTLGGKPDLFLQDLYRAQVGQPLTFNDQDTTAYCQNLAAVGAPRLKTDAVTEAKAGAPSFAMIGTNLATVLAARFNATWGNLTCPVLTGNPSPITVTVDPNTMLAATASFMGTQYTGPPPAAAVVTPAVTPTVTPAVTPTVTPTNTPTDTPAVTPADTPTGP